jgi:hypothetical protein
MDSSVDKAETSALGLQSEQDALRFVGPVFEDFQGGLSAKDRDFLKLYRGRPISAL